MKNFSKKCIGILLVLLLLSTAVISVGAITDETASESVTETETTSSITEETSLTATTADTQVTTEETTRAKKDLVSVGATGDMVYLRNTAGWSSVTCYAWVVNTNTSIAGWPGVAMEKITDDVYACELTGDFNMVIFSQGGQGQTADMSIPGNGYIYDNSTSQWDKYDDSDLQIKSFTTDVASPQYEGTAINLSVNATSTSAISYKFTVKTSGGVETTIKDFSSTNTATWIPVSADTYTLTMYAKDLGGNESNREMSYVIKDSSKETKPVIKGVLPNSGGQIIVNQNNTITVTESGGKTGTNLLFTKFVVSDPNGNQVNTAYYTLKNSYTIKPTSTGLYTVTVSVQASDNTVTTAKYNFYSVNIGDTTASTAPAPTGKKGDSNRDGEVNVKDATCIQSYLAVLIPASQIDLAVSDVTGDGEVNVRDATSIQKMLVGLEIW